MIFGQERPFAKAEAAARRLLEITNTITEPYGFVDIGQLNDALLREGASPDEYRAGIAKLEADGLVTIHKSGTRLNFTDKGAAKFG